MGPVIIAFLLAASVSSVVFFILKAVRRKKHPTEEDVQETNRQRREREKLEKQTMEKVTAKLQGKKGGEEEQKPNGLRSGKHNKKKKK